MRNISFCRLLLIGGIVLLSSTISCKKEAKEKEPSGYEVKTTLVSGKVILPSSMPVGSLTVNSGFDLQQVINGEYKITVAQDDFSLQFVADEKDKTLLLGLKFPGQTDYTINSSSTVIALLMSAPVVNSLTVQGKLDLIASIRSNAAFSNAVNKVEEKILSGKDLFDTTGGALDGILASLFDASALRRSDAELSNISVIRNGKKLIIENPGKSFAQSVGIYRDGQRVKNFILDRYLFFSTSVTAIPSTFFNPTQIVSAEYVMEADGKYDIKARTGRNFTDTEDKEALKDNLVNLTLDNLTYLLRFIPFANLNNECVKEIRTEAVSTVQSMADAIRQEDIGTAGKMTRIVASMSISLLRLTYTAGNCSLKESEEMFMKKAAGLIKYLDVVELTGTMMNNTLFAYQYFTSPAKSDTRFTVKGSEVTECDRGCGGATTFTDPRDGEIYKIVQIGSQCWFAENLRYSGDIPNVTDNTSWANTGTSAWAYYDNNAGYNATYGKLYNWYAVDMGTLCPSGWHIPTDAEWTVLTDYLGASASAKMKSTTEWCEKGNGDNNSGFTGLPGGYRVGNGMFYNIGYYGNWWSSMEFNTYDRWIRILYCNNSSVGRDYVSNVNGMSCRCVRD